MKINKYKKIHLKTYILHRRISACIGICSFLSFGMWLFSVWLLGLFVGFREDVETDVWCVHTDNVIHSLWPQNSYLYHIVTDIYRTADERAERPPVKAAQVCFGPADTADMPPKGFLMNPCPNTFPSEKSRLVWKHLIAQWMVVVFLFFLSFFATRGILVTDWVMGAKQFSFLLVDSDREVPGSIGSWVGGSNLWTCVFDSGALLFIDVAARYRKSIRI